MLFPLDFCPFLFLLSKMNCYPQFSVFVHAQICAYLCVPLYFPDSVL
uniref:Uncharacterized protein n=1 Tax=Rhizophora mucronata TaxID=61149 RepID=A0A2P2N693_RHIMU